MSSHLTGSKRLAVIQRWINGHDDPDWEVLPTRKEGKYIVKRRPVPLEYENDTEETSEKVEEIEEPEEIEEKPRKVKTPRMRVPKPQKVPESQDPTVNLEILNQLKLLGEEIKSKRERKEQKRIIKEVVDKQFNKPKQYYPQEYMYKQIPHPPPQEPEQEQYAEPIPPQPYYFNRRNRIFGDI